MSGIRVISALIFSMLTAVTLGGCASLRAPTAGVLYSDSQAGLTATSNQAGNRVGEACVSSILGLISSGDASIEAARRNGGITMISAVDESFFNVLFFYSKYCTIVRGR